MHTLTSKHFFYDLLLRPAEKSKSFKNHIFILFSPSELIDNFMKGDPRLL